MPRCGHGRSNFLWRTARCPLQGRIIFTNQLVIERHEIKVWRLARSVHWAIDMSDSYQKSFPVSWEELHRTSKALAWRLLELGPFKGLVAVTRGGLVPAAIVARELEIRLIDTACISSYNGSERGALDILKHSDIAGDGKGWLIVDDLVDTGETAKALRTMMPNAHFATVYAKPAGRPLVDTFVTEVSQDTWIFFPWDMEPKPSTPIIGQR